MQSKALLSFLNELSAIPSEIRNDYINSLSKRSPSETNAIIRLLIISNTAIANDNIEDVSEESICNTLGITSSLLTCYRSRLLKRIREHYFKKTSAQNSNLQFSANVKEYSLDSVSQLFNTGQLREAKTHLLKTEKEYSAKLNALKKKTTADAINELICSLSSIYEMICIYYFQTHNHKYFIKYLKKFQALENSIKRHKKLINYKTIGLYSLLVNLVISRKFLYKIINDKQIKNAVEHILIAFKEAKKINNTTFIFRTAFDLGKGYSILNRDKDARKYYEAAYKLALKINLPEYIILFKILLNDIEFRKDVSLGNSHLKYIEKNYDKIFNGNLYFLYVLKVQLIYMQLLIHSNDISKFNKCAQDLFKRLYLYSMKSEADVRIYLDKADEYSKNIFSVTPVFDDELNIYRLELKVNEDWIRKLENLNNAYRHSIKNIESISTLCIIYLTILETEIWKGKKCNFENAYYFIEKLQRLIRTRNLSIHKIWFDTNFICIKMMDEMLTDEKSEVYKKYHNRYLRTYYDNFKSPIQKANLINEFAKLKFVADKFNIAELKKDLIELEKWINTNRPELITNLLENKNI